MIPDCEHGVRADSCLRCPLARANKEIDRLRAQNAKLIEALKPFASLVQADGSLSGALMADVYRHAARVLREETK